MRQFSSYGPVDTDLNYYTPRKELIERTYSQLTGKNPQKGGHYFTVWAPRQSGKTWVMQEILFKLQKDPRFHVLKINLEHLKEVEDSSVVLASLAKSVGRGLGKNLTGVDTREKFQEIFRKDILDKPLILILDEFDALEEKGINAVVSAFRNIYINRTDEREKTTGQKTYLLHSVALIGVRSVLGIENKKGSPFNIQRSVHIPNLTIDEVRGMFQWYEKESGQAVEPEVIERLYSETNGQPGLTCWFGELLTEGLEYHQVPRGRSINMEDFEIILAAATYALPNNNILNLVSKAKEKDNKTTVLRMFQTDQKIEFSYDDKAMNSLYMNGVADREIVSKTRFYLKFSCPFVQKRLFNYFANELFKEMGALTEPFVSLDNVVTDTGINIPNLLKLYQTYLVKNSHWLFKSAPRRYDMKIYEAVFHFNLYSYLNSFLSPLDGRVYPEFPTGNGKIDLIVTYGKNRYGLELKSYSTDRNYEEGLRRAAGYGKQLNLDHIYMVVFVEYINDETRKKYEKDYRDGESGVTVVPLFIATGN